MPSLKKTKTFLCRYYHDNSWWAVDVDAYDLADAESRVKKLGNLMLDGELILTIPAKLGFFARLLCAARNLAKAGALIAAEIDRLQRKAGKETE